MNTISVQAQFEAKSQEIFAEIMIDDLLLGNHERGEFAIDLAELAKTLEHDGEFFIITCTCGDPGCAGITNGVQVHRIGETVQWQFNVRQADSEYMRTVSFAHVDYVTAIRQGLAQFTELYELHPDAEIVPYLMREQTASLKAN